MPGVRQGLTLKFRARSLDLGRIIGIGLCPPFPSPARLREQAASGFDASLCRLRGSRVLYLRASVSSSSSSFTPKVLYYIWWQLIVYLRLERSPPPSVSDALL